MTARLQALGLSLILVAGCAREPEGGDTGKGRDTDTVTTTPYSDETTPETDTDTDTTTVPAFDCTTVPTVPQAVETIDIYTEEDFDFDLQGYLVYQSLQDIVGRNQYGGFKVISADVSSDAAGIQTLANGDIVVAAPDSGVIKYVDRETGANHALIGGLSFPNGLESGAGNIVYFTELSGDRVRSIDTVTLVEETISSKISSPNGLAFGPGEATLYVVGSVGADSVVMAIDRVGDLWDVPREIIRSDVSFDGVETDICGNVYVTEFSTGRLLRFDPVTGINTELADIVGGGSFSSMRWGNGIGGWDTETLYVTNRNDIFAIHAGVPGNTDPLDP